MRIPIAPQIAAWYATRLCEFVNLPLSRNSWRSLFFEDAKDDAHERFRKAVQSQVGKRTFRALQKSHPEDALNVWRETVATKFSPARSKTFAAVQEQQKESREFLQKIPAAAEKVKEAESVLPLLTFGAIWQEQTQRQKISVAPVFGNFGENHFLDIGGDDLRSELHLLHAVALGARIGQCACPCRRFFVAKRRGEKLYYSPQCAEGITAAKRVKEYRERRTKWEGGKKVLIALLADISAIERKQKPQRPRSEREVLGEGEKALKKAQAAFVAAFPLKKGQGYEEGKAVLAGAERQILRLRKKVKGY